MSLHLVVFDDFTNVIQVLVRENEPNVSLDVRQDSLQLWVVLKVASNCLPNGGVFAHDDGRPTTKRHANLLHLFGANIVHIDHQEPWVLVQETLYKKKEDSRE